MGRVAVRHKAVGSARPAVTARHTISCVGAEIALRSKKTHAADLLENMVRQRASLGWTGACQAAVGIASKGAGKRADIVRTRARVLAFFALAHRDKPRAT